MKKVKILKKPKKTKKQDIKKILAQTSTTPKSVKQQSKEAQNYFNFYDDIKNPNQIYDW